MAEESKQRVHILRLFGMEQAALVRILREAAAQGCPGLRLLEQGGEQAVCVRARSQSPEDLDLAAPGGGPDPGPEGISGGGGG